MAPGSDQYEDDYQSYSCYSDLGLGPCCLDCTVDYYFFESTLVIDCCSTIDTNMEVIDTEQWQRKDTDNMEWEPLETNIGGGHLLSQHLSPLLSFSYSPNVASYS